jgi:hypothetical protein
VVDWDARRLLSRSDGEDESSQGLPGPEAKEER